MGPGRWSRPEASTAARTSSSSRVVRSPPTLRLPGFISDAQVEREVSSSLWASAHLGPPI